VTDIFLNHLWPSLAVWAVIYASDYFFTIACARLYRATAKDQIIFEGSFELNPNFQKDVDGLRRLSPRFLLALLASTTFLALLWWVTGIDPTLRGFYIFGLGILFLTELALQTRHLRNFFLFRTAFGPDGIRGRIEYPRRVMLQLSSFEFLGFAGLYLVLFLLTWNWFVLGGAMGCSWRSPGNTASSPANTSSQQL